MELFTFGVLDDLLPLHTACSRNINSLSRLSIDDDSGTINNIVVVHRFESEELPLIVGVKGVVSQDSLDFQGLLSIFIGLDPIVLLISGKLGSFNNKELVLFKLSSLKSNLTFFLIKREP